MLKEVYHDALTGRNIVNAFSTTGIFPLNRDAIKDKALQVPKAHDNGEPQRKIPVDFDSTPRHPLEPIKPILGVRKRKNSAQKPRLFLPTICEENDEPREEIEDNKNRVENVRPKKTRKTKIVNDMTLHPSYQS